MRYRKKPIVIEAVRVKATDFNGKTWDGVPFSEYPDWLAEAIADGRVVPVTPGHTDYAEWEIRTLEGVMLAGPDDWIIRGIQGELYPCKHEIFTASYEPVDPPLSPRP